jgi:hypothetical protein
VSACCCIPAAGDSRIVNLVCEKRREELRREEKRRGSMFFEVLVWSFAPKFNR